MTERTVLIVLNYMHLELTERLLKQIETYQNLYKIILVDNCSPNITQDELEKYKTEKVDVIRTEKNLGYAAGNNYGANWAIEKYHPTYLGFANPDVLFEENVVCELIKCLKISNHYALGSALVEKGYNIWKRPDYWGTIRSMFLVIHNVEKVIYRASVIRKKRFCEVEVVEGSFFIVKAKAFEDVGGFDENTFLYYEENLLSYKLNRAGYKEIVLTDYFYQHLHGGTIRKVYGKKAKAFRNYKKSLLIYLSDYLKIGELPKRMFNVFYFGAYIERIIYDLLINNALKSFYMRIRSCRKNGKR